jgi:3-oxoacyl-[acyl-carrier protein] reductase
LTPALEPIASEYAGTGVTSNALAPALIDTDMIASMPDMRSQVPVGRLGTPDDVATLVAYLCSAHGGYITGEVVDVNGGFLID